LQGNLDRLFVSLHRARLLGLHFLILLAGNEGVGDFLKGVEDRLFIPEPGFLPHGPGLSVLGDEGASLENRSRQIPGHGPKIGGSRREIGKLRACLAKQRGQAYPREEVGHGDAHLRVGGPQALLRLPDVGAAFQQGRGQARRDLHRQALIQQARGALHRGGIAPEQHIDLVFLENNLPFQFRNIGGG